MNSECWLMKPRGSRNSSRDLDRPPPVQAAEDFPGLKRSRALYGKTSHDASTELATEVHKPQPALSPPVFADNPIDIQPKRVSDADVKASQRRSQWPNGVPPSAPKSLRTDVSPPSVRRGSSWQWHRERPSSWQKGDSYRPGEEHGARYDRQPDREFRRGSAGITPHRGESYYGDPRRPTRHDEPKLRDVFKPVRAEARSFSNYRNSSPPIESRISRPRSPILTHSAGDFYRTSEGAPGATCVDERSKGSVAVNKRLVQSSPISHLPEASLPSEPPKEEANRKKPGSLLLSPANKSSFLDDMHSLRSDGTTSSGMAISGRSSTTSRPQTTRCYACKDSKVVSEQADRAELLENYVYCVQCSRRYHTRCARGFGKDCPWTCYRCSTKSSRKSGKRFETSVTSSPLLRPALSDHIVDKNERLMKSPHHLSKDSVGRAQTPKALVQPLPLATSEPIVDDPSPHALDTATEDTHIPDSLTQMGTSHGPDGQTHKNSVPAYLEGWQARDHESQRSSVGPSVPSRQGSEYAQDRAVHHDIAFSEDGSHDAVGGTARANTILNTAVFVDGPEDDQGAETYSKPDENGLIGADRAETSTVREELKEGATQEFTRHTTLLEEDSSRDTSYSPPPAMPLSQSSKSTNANMARRNCTECGKTILSGSATELCSKCQQQQRDEAPISASANQLQTTLQEAQTNIASAHHAESGLASADLYAPSINSIVPMIHGSPKRRRSTLEPHLVQKKPRLGYQPPKDAVRKPTARKSASNFTGAERAPEQILSAMPRYTPSSTSISSRLSSTEFGAVAQPSDINHRKGESSIAPQQVTMHDRMVSDVQIEMTDAPNETLTTSPKQATQLGRPDNAEVSSVDGTSSLEHTEDQRVKVAHDELIQSQAALEREQLDRQLEAGLLQEKLKEAENENEILKRQFEATAKELELLRQSNATKVSLDGRKSSPQVTISIPALRVEHPGKARLGEPEPRSLTRQDHFQRLKQRGVMFELESDSEDDSDFWPSPRSKAYPRDPLYQARTMSKDLFEVAPHYLQENLDNISFIEAKKVEISKRPRRKATFGKVLSDRAKKDRGLDPHQEVDRQREDRKMTITMLDELTLDRIDDQETRETTVSFEDLIGMPDSPHPFLVDGQLTMARSMTRNGRNNLRAKDSFRVGS